MTFEEDPFDKSPFLELISHIIDLNQENGLRNTVEPCPKDASISNFSKEIDAC